MPPADAHRQPQILFVDDEAHLLHVGRILLEQLGYRVVARTRAEEALEIFLADPDAFDLILADQVMPEISGVDLARRILQVRPELPIILCTGLAHSPAIQGPGGIPAHRVLMKPIASHELMDAVQEALQGSARSTAPPVNPAPPTRGSS